MDSQDYYQKPKNKIFFDIETIPADENTKEVAVSLALQKANKYNNDKKTKSRESLYRLTAISGDFGQIFCIGYALNDQNVEIIVKLSVTGKAVIITVYIS